MKSGPRDRKFRHELFPEGVALAALSEDIVSRALDYEKEHETRQRKRRKQDLVAFRNAVAVIVANLAHIVLFPADDTGNLILPLGHARCQRRHRVPGFGKALKATVDVLQAIDVLTAIWPECHLYALTVRPTDTFRELIWRCGVSGRKQFTRKQVLDPVCLTSKDECGRKVELAPPTTPEAMRIREEVCRINDWLSFADISYEGDEPVDTTDRLMRRRFTRPADVEGVTLEYGGRLFGGFWQPMRRELRRHIRIGNEPLAELDYGQILPRLAYARTNQKPPVPDIYDLELPMPWRVERRIVKKAFNSFLFSSKRLGGWPLEIEDGLPKPRGGEKLSVDCFRRALLHRHPALQTVLEVGIGHRLMNTESSILCAVLKECMARDVAVLPIHDAVLCPISQVATVTAIMERQALNVSGCSIPVGVERL